MAGLSVFSAELQNRNVIIYSDNTGAEGATSKVYLLLLCSSVSVTALRLLLQGAAKRFDRSSLVHCIWKVLATTKTGAYIKRVPTLENIADLPSRCDGRPTLTLSIAGIRIYIQGMLRPFGKAARATEKRLISVPLRGSSSLVVTHTCIACSFVAMSTWVGTECDPT